MGKAKKEKARLRQARQKAKEAAGGGLPSSPLPSLVIAPLESPAQRQQLLETLTSGTATQKAIACHAVAHQVSNASFSSSASSSPFLQPQLLSRLLALLFAADYDARFAASVALHALSSMSPRACAALLKQDALTACLSLLSHPSLLPLDGPRRDRLLVEAVGIIRDLTENADTALMETSASAALRSLFALLTPQQGQQGQRRAEEGGRVRLQVEVASLLLQMTEQNEQLVAAISGDQAAISLLLSTMAEQKASAMLRLTIAGIVINLQTPQQIRLLSTAFPPSSSSSASSQLSSSPHSIPAGALSSLQAAVALLCSALQEDVAAVSREYLHSMKAERERLYAAVSEGEGKQLRQPKQAEPSDGQQEVEMKEGEAEEAVMRTETEEKAMQAEPSMEVEEARLSAARKRELRPSELERDSQRRVELMTGSWQERVNAVKLALELLSNLTAEDDEEEEDEAEETKQPSAEEKETAASTSWLSGALAAADSFTHAARLLDSELAAGGQQSERELVTTMLGDDYGDGCVALLTSMRCRAASFLTNLVLYLPPAAVAPHLPGIMQRCSQRLTQLLSAPVSASSSTASGSTSASASASPSSPPLQSSDAGLEEMESLTGLFFVISKSQHIAASASSSPVLSASQLQSLLQLLTLPSTAPSIRLNLLDIAAVVASHPVSASLCVEPVTAAVLSLLRPCHAASSAEATELLDRCLNVLMDCYAEDGVHGELLVRLAVLPALQEAAGALQRLAGGKGGGQRGEDRRRHLETVSNVREFLRYKPQHI